LAQRQYRNRIPAVAPFLVVEILSLEDRMVRMLPKIQAYLSIGVEYVWVIDPEEKAALSYSRTQPEGAAQKMEAVTPGHPRRWTCLTG
jgi:Uma2 family endonuclease